MNRYVMATATLCLAWSTAVNAQQECLTRGFQNDHLRYAVNVAKAGSNVGPLKTGKPLDHFQYYSPSLKRNVSLDEYLENNCVTGLLVLKDGAIVYERYLRGRKPQDMYFSASVSKSVLSLLFGIAISEGKLSLTSKVTDFLPDYKASAFGSSSIEDLLRMSAGVKLVSNFLIGGNSDNFATSTVAAPNQNIEKYLQEKRETVAPPGVVFHYNGAISALLGIILNKATGTTATQYLEEKIWGPMGAEANAYWIKNYRGEEGVQGQFNATLRDYARLGLLVMNKGKANGVQIVPESWIEQMTAIRKDKAQPKSPPYYGFHIWLPVVSKGVSQMEGINGQFVFVDPNDRVVIVQLAVLKEADGAGFWEFFPFRNALLNTLKEYH
jgi:CubicO group peptidase (beta-lactamase class C family)